MQTYRNTIRPLVGSSLVVLCLTTAAPAQTNTQPVNTSVEAVQSDQEPSGFGAFAESVLAAVGLGPAADNEFVDVEAAEPVTQDTTELERPILRAVELIRPGAEQTVLERNFFGRVVAKETANLAFPLNGKLEEFPVEEGSVVEAGSLLAGLDLDPFERAVERAEIQLAQAERAYQRADDLARRDIGPKTVAEDTQSARDLAEVQLREVKDALADAQIVAPYRALIAERLTANHVIVEPGAPVVRVHDISQMRVEIDVPERLVQRLPDISAVELSALLPGDSERSRLEIIEFDAETEDVGQSYTFTLALPNRSGTVLLPGSSLTVLAALPSPAPALVLPTTAISADEQRQPYVMVFEPSEGDQGVLRAVAVDVASVDGNSFSVSGLPGDVEIVKAGAHLLRDGQVVRRFTSLRVEE